MSTEKTLAIVLRTIDFSETSSIVTLLTRDFGKISGLAKGARRPKGPFESALDLLALCRIVFLHRSSDSLDLVTEAKLERRFRVASRDLSCLYAGYYIAELLVGMTEENDPHPELFDVAEITLSRLNDGADVAPLLLQFELSLLHQLGHLPSLELCVGCGKEVSAERRLSFGLLAGGVLCQRCRVGKRKVVSVSPRAMQALRSLAATAIGAQPDCPVDTRVRGELRAIMNHYICHLLGRKPRLHQFLAGVLQ